MNIDVKIKKLRPNAQIPQYATDGSAAADLHAAIDEPLTILPNQRIPIPTGFAISPERDDVVALIFGRSGLGTKYGITLANSVGVIDSDYRGEIHITLTNRGDEPYTIQPGERLAQMMFVPIYHAKYIETDELDDTDRGTGGFGSTGKV